MSPPRKSVRFNSRSHRSGERLVNEYHNTHHPDDYDRHVDYNSYSPRCRTDDKSCCTKLKTWLNSAGPRHEVYARVRKLKGSGGSTRRRSNGKRRRRGTRRR
jgi:hypothetical protein